MFVNSERSTAGAKTNQEKKHKRCIKATSTVRQFSANGDSHRANDLCRTAVNSHRKPALWLLKRRDGNVHHPPPPSISWDGGCIPKVHLSLGREGRRLRRFLSITNTRWVKVFCRWQTLFFGQKCREESVGQAGGQTLLHYICGIFFLI